MGPTLPTQRTPKPTYKVLRFFISRPGSVTPECHIFVSGAYLGNSCGDYFHIAHKHDLRGVDVPFGEYVSAKIALSALMCRLFGR